MKFFQLAYQFQLKGKNEDAIFYYHKSLEIEETAEGYTFLGWAYSNTGRYEEAIKHCRQAIEIDPEFGNPYNDIGSYHIELDRLDEAEVWLMRAKKAKRYENREFPFINMGRLYELRGLWPLALTEYAEAAQINPGNESAKLGLEKLEARLN